MRTSTPKPPSSLVTAVATLAASTLAFAFPGSAQAQTTATTPPVQPVPYASSQPVPYPATPPPAPAPALAAAAPGFGSASEAGGDVVYLKGGGMIRGALVEAIPDDHATVQLATGQSAIIPWVRIARIDRAKALGAATPSASPGSASAAAREPTAIVHVNADRQVVLERRDARGGPWTLACSSPCDAALPLSSTYRIAGAGVRNTRPFQLQARADEQVTLDVNLASRGAFAGGIVMASTGVAAMVTGIFVLLIVQTDQSESALLYGTQSTDSSGTTVGWAFVAGGAALTIGGAILLGSNVHSKEQQQDPRQAEASRRPPPKKVPVTDAWLRAPTWHDDKGGSLAPKVITEVPLFHGTF